MSQRCNRCRPLPPEMLEAADVLGRRWALALLCASHEGAVRFNEFRQALREVPPRTLAQRLADLEAAGLLERRVVDARPPYVEYRLTPRGVRLEAVVDVLRHWPSQRA
jgi:DNA-binding HxlR family transcriptional regulator